MRILQLSTKVPYPPKDGGAAGVYVFSEVLQKLGHSVAVLAVNPPKHYIPPSVLAEMPIAISIYPVQVDTKPMWYRALYNLSFKTLPYQVERFINKSFEAKLVELLDTFSPDIVQIEGIYLCPYIPVIRKRSKARIVLRAHNVEHVLWHELATNEKHLAKKLYLNIQAKRIKTYETVQLSLVDGITTVTDNDKAILLNYASTTTIKVIPFGLLPAEKQADRKYPVTSVAFIGALDWLPNQEALQWFLTEVWTKVRLSHPYLTFHIAGRNVSSTLETLIKQQDQVIFHGEVPDSKAFLDQFSVLLVPLFSGSGIRVKIIEAMQQGLAVIASSKAAEGMPVADGEHLLLADTPEDFITGISKITESHDLLTKLSVNSMAFVKKKFDILAIGKELVEFYNTL